MTAESVLLHNAGKQPAEIINALYLAGFAVVPREAIPGVEGTRMLNITKTFGEQYERIVEFARAKA